MEARPRVQKGRDVPGPNRIKGSANDLKEMLEHAESLVYECKQAWPKMLRSLAGPLNSGKIRSPLGRGFDESYLEWVSELHGPNMTVGIQG